MSNPNLILSYPGFMTSNFREGILWLQLSGNFFHNFNSFDNRDFLQDYFNALAEDQSVKTVVIQSAYSESGMDEYLRFFLFECPERDLGHFGLSNTMSRYDLHRFCNIIDQTILNIATLNKIVIHVCGGDVISLFMNLSMACDYRIITSDTVFYNIFQEIGMLSKGGGAFFLGRALGPSRAKNLLLLHERIFAQEAMELGIADEMVAPEALETAATNVARRFEAISEATLTGTKRLVNYPVQALKEYLEYETRQIIRIAHRDDFSDQ